MNAVSKTHVSFALSGLTVLAASGLFSSAVQAVTADNVVCSGCVNTGDIAGGAVTSAKIADGTITGGDVASEALTHNDILDEPGIDMINHSGQGIFSSMSPNTWITQQQITITHPAPGWVMCTAQGTLKWNTSTNSPAIGYVGWSDSSSGTPAGYSSAKPTSANGSGPLIPVSSLRTFLVVGSGSKTFYLKAKANGGVNGDIGYYSQGAACLYFPVQY